MPMTKSGVSTRSRDVAEIDSQTAMSARGEEVSMIRRLVLLLLIALPLLVLSSGDADAAIKKIQMLDRTAVSKGIAKVNLAAGTVAVSVTLARLPASIDTGGTPFDATIYKAYLTSSTDPSVEIPLATVYPTTKGHASFGAALKGDVSQLGLDRVVVTAYSKDGLSSFDVLTGTIPVP
jgi:hypothetical protein